MVQVDRQYFTTGETATVSTTNNSIIVIYANGSGNITIRDTANNVLATLQLYDIYTLPKNSGQYVISYDGTTEAFAFLVRVIE